MPVRVVLADDHEIFRDGFQIMLEKQEDIEFVGEAGDGMELLSLVKETMPDVVITDIKMPKLDGIEATKKLSEEFPGIGIIAFSMFDEDSLIVDMLEAGARGYLLKNATKTEIFDAIKTVYAGGSYYCNHTTGKLAKLIGKSNFKFPAKIERPSFNDKELKIIELVCRELSNKEIAAAMFLSVRTVEGYREKIVEKMEVKNTAGIVIYAIKNNLFKLT